MLVSQLIIIMKYINVNNCLLWVQLMSVNRDLLIEKSTDKQNRRYVCYPGIGTFFVQTFDRYYQGYVFEEFNYRFYKSSFLKRLVVNRPYGYPVKM